MSKQLKLGFIIAILIQIFILIGMLVSANLPLWFGQEVKVHTRPIDPRSLFRGNYAWLRYPLERYSPKETQPIYHQSLRKGEVVYLSLKQDDKGIYTSNTLTLQPPESEVYLKGRVTYPHPAETSTSIRLKFANLNAFFAPKEKALALQKQVRREGAIAVLMVSKKGKAIIKEIITRSEE